MQKQIGRKSRPGFPENVAARCGGLLLSLALAGCASTQSPPIGTAAPPAPAVDSVPEPPAPGVVGVSIGQTLDESDRRVAIAVQQEAFASGARKSWRGAKGAYGFIIPGPETGTCRAYTHKIFINGRPQEGKGEACLKDGVWRAN